MAYPTSCGANGTITAIPLDCLNDILKEGSCNTSFAATSNPNSFTLVGATARLLPFSTYGLDLAGVKTTLDTVATKYPILCQTGTYTDPTGPNNSTVDTINAYSTELNGLSAQYMLLFDQYIQIRSTPPTNIASTAQATITARNNYLTSPTNATAALADAAAEASVNAATAYQAMLTSIQTDIATLNTQITRLENTINESLKRIAPEEANYVAKIQSNTENLKRKIVAMNTAFDNLNIEKIATQQEELDGNYEVAEVKTSSNFMKHMLYLLFALVVAGCLIYINISPTESKLDLFISALGCIVLLYYGYDYFQNRK
jgi:hypothetical protein